jgi:hypothetical protein
MARLKSSGRNWGSFERNILMDFRNRHVSVKGVTTRLNTKTLAEFRTFAAHGAG